MRISDWSSDVCSSDLVEFALDCRTAGNVHGHDDSAHLSRAHPRTPDHQSASAAQSEFRGCQPDDHRDGHHAARHDPADATIHAGAARLFGARCRHGAVTGRSAEHTSELQSLMRISYAVFCLKKKTKTIYIS